MARVGVVCLKGSKLTVTFGERKKTSENKGHFNPLSMIKHSKHHRCFEQMCQTSAWESKYWETEHANCCALGKPKVISLVSAVIRSVSRAQEGMGKNEHNFNKDCKDNWDFCLLKKDTKIMATEEKPERWMRWYNTDVIKNIKKHTWHFCF